MNHAVKDIRDNTVNLPDNKLLLECSRHLHANKLALPTIPDVSFKIRRAINDENANSAKIARVVQIDPSITARLIKISNCPLYRGRKPIESCPEALTRLGLRAARDIITAFSMKSVFNAKSPLIRQKMLELWGHSSNVAAISAVFAHKIKGFDPDRAMLAGLIHDIGIVPILTHADNHLDIMAGADDLTVAIKKLRADIGVKIIRQWDFPVDFEEVVVHAEDWYRDNDNPPNYADIVMIAQLHSYIGKVDIKTLPKIAELPAYQKLAGHLDASDSIGILDKAKEEIEQIRLMLA